MCTESSCPNSSDTCVSEHSTTFSPFGLLQVQLTYTIKKTPKKLKIVVLLCRIQMSIVTTLHVAQFLIAVRSCHPLSVFKGGAASAVSMASISLCST